MRLHFWGKDNYGIKKSNDPEILLLWKAQVRNMDKNQVPAAAQLSIQP